MSMKQIQRRIQKVHEALERRYKPWFAQEYIQLPDGRFQRSSDEAIFDTLPDGEDGEIQIVTCLVGTQPSCE